MPTWNVIALGPDVRTRKNPSIWRETAQKTTTVRVLKIFVRKKTHPPPRSSSLPGWVAGEAGESERRLLAWECEPFCGLSVRRYPQTRRFSCRPGSRQSLYFIPEGPPRSSLSPLCRRRVIPLCSYRSLRIHGILLRCWRHVLAVSHACRGKKGKSTHRRGGGKDRWRSWRNEKGSSGAAVRWEKTWRVEDWRKWGKKSTKKINKAWNVTKKEKMKISISKFLCGFLFANCFVLTFKKS